ncbi:MAG TPA: hypothetical protein VHQ47_02665 [Phycisphaerae bacterium]|nr:hypothetical protein [Phycisphaerae bacterium]
MAASARESGTDDDRLAVVHEEKALSGVSRLREFSVRYDSRSMVDLEVGKTYFFIFAPGETRLLGCLEIRGDACISPYSRDEIKISDLLKSISNNGNRLPKGIVDLVPEHERPSSLPGDQQL